MQNRGVRTVALVAAVAIVGATVTIVVMRGRDPRPVDLTPDQTVAAVATTAPVCETETHEWTLVEDGYDNENVVVVTATTRVQWTERCAQVVDASVEYLHDERAPGYAWCGTSSEQAGYLDAARTQWHAFAAFSWDTPGGSDSCQPFSYQDLVVTAGHVEWATGRSEGVETV